MKEKNQVKMNNNRKSKIRMKKEGQTNICTDQVID